MPGWTKTLSNGLPLYKASTMSWLPGIVQGFTTRNGGTSAQPFDSFNLSYAVGDDPASVDSNRAALASSLNCALEYLVFAEQVHGNRVAIVDSPASEPIAGVDALVTNTYGLVLTLLFADCIPVYFVDPIKKVVALAHSGWKGSAGNIVQATTDMLIKRFDVNPRLCQVAIGPGISGENYEVGPDVAQVFREAYASGASTPIVLKNEWQGKWELHLRRVIFVQLLAAGYKAESIEVCEDDTFRNSEDFYSYRRESRQEHKTGRMAAFLGLI